VCSCISLFEKKCNYMFFFFFECGWLFVSFLSLWDGLATCPGFTLTPVTLSRFKRV